MFANRVCLMRVAATGMVILRRSFSNASREPSRCFAATCLLTTVALVATLLQPAIATAAICTFNSVTSTLDCELLSGTTTDSSESSNYASSGNPGSLTVNYTVGNAGTVFLTGTNYLNNVTLY